MPNRMYMRRTVRFVVPSTYRESVEMRSGEKSNENKIIKSGINIARLCKHFVSKSNTYVIHLMPRFFFFYKFRIQTMRYVRSVNL